MSRWKRVTVGFALVALVVIAASLPVAGLQAIEPLFAAFWWSLAVLTFAAALSLVQCSQRAVWLRIGVGVFWVTAGLVALAGAALAMATVSTQAYAPPIAFLGLLVLALGAVVLIAGRRIRGV